MVRVPVRTIDDIWREHRFPRVSVIKMDIEGGELLALQGAKQMILGARPTIIVEWTDSNLQAYATKPAELLRISDALGYVIYAFPSLVCVKTTLLLTLAMQQTETFVLAPR